MAYWNFSSFTNKLPLARNTWNIGAVKQLFRLYHLLIAIHTKDSDLFRGPDAVPTFGTVMFEAVLQSTFLWHSPPLFHPTRHPLSQPSHTSRRHDKIRLIFWYFYAQIARKSCSNSAFWNAKKTPYGLPYEVSLSNFIFPF